MEDARNALPAWDPQANASRVVNDPGQLEKEFLAGKLHLVGDHQYNLVGPDGKVWLTPAASVQEALGKGFHFAAATDVDRAEANTALGGLRAVADGALDAATLGFGDALQVKAGVDPHGIKARAEANPELRAVGMVGGALIPALATGGASLGGLAEAATARAIGTEAAATTLGRMAATAAGGAAEGAAYGVGDQVSEAVLGDTPLAADSLIASGMHGAFWGGATGALLGRVFNRVPTGKVRPTADEINAAMSRQLGEEAPKGYGKAVLNLFDKGGAAALEAQGAGDIADVLRGPAAGRKRFIDLAQTPQAELDAGVRKLRDAVDARLETHDAEEDFLKMFGVKDAGVDSGRMQEFVNSITRPKSDPRLAALRNFAGDDPHLNGLLDDLTERQAAKNLLRDQLSREQAGGMDLELAAGLVGHGFGGFGGALMAREAAQNVTRPAHAMLARYRMAATIERVHGYVRERMDDFAAGVGKVGRAIELDRKLAPTTMLMLNGSRDERRKAVATRITELQVDPELLATQLEAATQHTNADAPDVSGVMRQRLAAAQDILRQVTPQPLGTAGAGGGLVPRSAHVMIPDKDIRRFAEVDATMQDPLRIVDQLAKHQLPDPAAVSAFQVAYPALWQHVVQSLVESLQRNPDAVGWKQAIALSVTLGLESHPSFAPASLNLQQALAKQKPAPRPGPVSRALGRATDQTLSGAYATINDRLMDRPTRR